MENKILQGDALTKLKELPDKSINMCMTSPPYWALRDYGVDGQLGLEPTFDKYISDLCDIFDEVKKVLRDDGTCWVNLGDTYGGSGGASGHKEDTKNLGYTTKDMGAVAGGSSSYQSKCLVSIPARFQLEMINRGWILRNTIIWHKPNCMPCSVKDRFTVDFEYIFFFSKKKKYYFETQLEPLAESTLNDSRLDKGLVKHKSGKSNQDDCQYAIKGMCANSKGRNKRTVWRICPKPFKEAHFAVYPEELCETPIKAGCPEEVCKKCGKPKEKVFEVKCGEGEGKPYNPNRPDGYIMEGRNRKSEHIFKGYTDCGCNAGFTSGIVLDPFFGAGTTGLVALKQKKKFIGIELNKEYIEIAEKRLNPFLEQTHLACPTEEN